MLFEIFVQVLRLSRKALIDLGRVHLHYRSSFIVNFYCIVGDCSLDRNDDHLSYVNVCILKKELSIVISSTLTSSPFLSKLNSQFAVLVVIQLMGAMASRWG